MNHRRQHALVDVVVRARRGNSALANLRHAVNGFRMVALARRGKGFERLGSLPWFSQRKQWPHVAGMLVALGERSEAEKSFDGGRNGRVVVDAMVDHSTRY